MKETTKAYVRRRKHDAFWKDVFKGRGIDVGSGDDPFNPEWFPGTTIETFDLHDGDAQRITSYRHKEVYDFVHSSNCLEHMPSPFHALTEWFSLVKPGGHLVFTVPDEDLYEQGVFPSKWNGDHRNTFTIFKETSWCPKSVSLAKLISMLPRCEIRRIEMADSNYDRDKIGSGEDQTFDAENGAEAFIEVVLRKAKQIEPREGLIFKHSGARGDIIYSLPTIAAFGGGTLLISTNDKHYVGRGMDEAEVESLCELLKRLPYITDAKVHRGERVNCDLDDFRDLNINVTHLAETHLMRFGVNYDTYEPWMVSSDPECLADIIISRSARYHGMLAWHVLEQYESKCLFLGLDDEYEAFKKETGMNIPHKMADSHLELARIVSGAKLFIGNQSYAYSLAEAMKLPRVLEVCELCPNCNPNEGNGHIELTEAIVNSALDGNIIQSAPDGRRTRQAYEKIDLPAVVPPKMYRLRKDRPLVSVILPVDGDDIQEAVYRKQALEGDGVEILIAWLRDGDPPEELGDVISFGSNAWMTRAINDVAERASGEFICLVDTDVCVGGDGLADIIRQFGDQTVGLVGQDMSYDGFPHIRKGCLMMSRRAYERCGFMNQNMRRDGWHGLEMCLRLQEAGYGNRQARSRDISMGDPEPTEGKGPHRNADYIRRRYGVKV